jgi:putative acyl-CoA dehydrogenase
VQCLDVLRALARNPECIEAFAAEVGEGVVADRRLDEFGRRLRDDLASDPETLESRARGLVERMALALQASLLVRYGDPAVADAFCASRLTNDAGLAFGTLPSGVDFARIIERHSPSL